MQRSYSIKPRKQPITSEVAKTFKETIDLTFMGKGMKRCVDHRSSLLKVTHIMKVKLPGTNLKSLTKRKFCGKYFHGIISHSAFQFRVLSGAAMNVEDKERIFNTIKSITNSTSYQNIQDTS